MALLHLQAQNPSLNTHADISSQATGINLGLNPSLNAHADVSSRARGINLGLSLHVHQYFVFASSKGYGKSMHMCRLARAFTDQ